MDTLRFFKTYLILTLGRLRRQLWLLVGLALFCLFLSLGAGQAAGQLLSKGVDFSGVALAVTSPVGDDTARLVERYLAGMEDVAQYCRLTAMEEDEAWQALAAGEVTAVLSLPEHFVQGVMWGENPDVWLTVDGSRPLESLLLLWVGQSASDLLSAFQGGIYAVLELYGQSPPEGLTRGQVVFDINLRCITRTLDRANFFRLEAVSATQALPIPLHYGLSLLSYFALSAAPLFMPVYSGDWLGVQRRLRAAGRSSCTGLCAGLAAGVFSLALLLIPALLALGEGNLLVLPAAVGMAAYCSLSSALCCLAAGSAARSGTLAFLIGLPALALGGGIVPPVLLPSALGRLGWLSPVTWLRQLAAWSLGYPVSASTWVCLLLSAAGMAALALALYRRGVERQEAEA